MGFQKREDYKKMVVGSFSTLLEEKGLDWKKGWKNWSLPRNAITGKSYRGLNRVNLIFWMLKHGIEDPRWATFDQIADRYGKYHKGQEWKLKKGSKGLPVEYWMPLDLKEKKIVSWEKRQADINAGRKEIRDFELRVRFTTVFHAKDIEGMPDLDLKKVKNPFEKTEVVETISKNMGVPIFHDQEDLAFYRGSTDEIHLPQKEFFLSEYDLNSTGLHELAHATGHAKRLDRPSLKEYFGENRAYEELIAEVSSMFMGYTTETNMLGEHLQNHKAYVRSWIYELQNNPEHFIEALKESEKVTAYLEWMGGLITEKDYQIQAGKYATKETKVEKKKEQYRFSKEEKREFYDQIKRDVSILSYAEEIGLTPERKGRYWSLKEYDSVRIDAEKNCFWRNSGRGSKTAGSIIDFVIAFQGLELSDAMKVLEERVGGFAGNIRNTEKRKVEVPSIKKEKEELVLPEKGQDMKRVFAYLTKTRGIDQEVIQSFVSEKNLYQDKKGNCVFVSYEEGKPVFGCLRGTHTGKRFLADLEGNHYDKGFYLEHGGSKLIVTESVIDGMSMMSLLKNQGLDWKGYDYMVLAGVTKAEPILKQVGRHNIEEVVLALDNDEAGKKATKEIQEILEGFPIDIKESFPKAKDWNEELLKGEKEELEVFFQDEKQVLKEPVLDFYKPYQGQRFEMEEGFER